MDILLPFVFLLFLNDVYAGISVTNYNEAFFFLDQNVQIVG